MQQFEEFQVDWSKVKKPKLTEKRPQKQQIIKKDQPNVDVFEKIGTCFRYRVASLISALGKQQYYCSFDQKLKKTAIAHPIKKSREEMLTRIVNQLELSCRFISRGVYQMVRQPLLKSMKIDIRDIQKRFKENKEFQKLYDDLDDLSEEQRLKDEEIDKKLDELVIPPESEIKQKIEQQRKINALNDAQHLYIVQGEYFDILKEYFNSLGWVEVPDLFSSIYEFKFCYAKRFLQKPIPDQVVNRFQQTKLLTTKYGLARSLRNCFCVSEVDSNTFFPRSYDLSDEQDFEDFLEDYKFTYAENYLKRHPQGKKSQLCVKILEKKMMNIHSKIEQILLDEYPVVTPTEWIELMKEEIEQQQLEQQEQQQQSKEILEKLHMQDPQARISRGDNIWVVKPVGLSRGRGVKYFKQLEEILAYAGGAKDVNFVVQKCVENIMTIQKKKFDIRQWIILSEVQPLTIFMYSECYVRFCGVEYSTEDLKNRYAHLTNFSVQKHGDDQEYDKLMMSQGEFAKQLLEMGFKFEDLRQQMSDIIIATLKSAQKSIEIRKNTFEIYGLDFIVDSDCKPWLIEINSSPTFGQSTSVTERLVQMGLSDLGHFIVDHYFENKRKKQYGGWEQIFKQKL